MKFRCGLKFLKKFQLGRTVKLAKYSIFRKIKK
jgi:hypothetical protein